MHYKLPWSFELVRDAVSIRVVQGQHSPSWHRGIVGVIQVAQSAYSVIFEKKLVNRKGPTVHSTVQIEQSGFRKLLNGCFRCGPMVGQVFVQGQHRHNVGEFRAAGGKEPGAGRGVAQGQLKVSMRVRQLGRLMS